jgi:acyl-CoA synthetase (AMP-forming)/AMP-acid ligase II
MDQYRFGERTLIDRLQEHAASVPKKSSYVFLADNASAQAISFYDLKQRVDEVAASFTDRFAPGERIMLLLPTGLDFIVSFLASLAAGLIAVPAYVPRKNRSDERLQAILSDATPAAVVSRPENSHLAELMRDWSPRIAVLSLADIEAHGSLATSSSRKRSNRVAFLQYTSGSTGRPRGVIVTHDNLIFNSLQLQQSFGHTPHSLVVSWLPLFHDMGLIGCVLQSLYVGFTSVFLSPVSFVAKPARWLQAASDFRATTIGGPNFAYDLCVKNVTPEEKRTLNLDSVQVAFNGSEPVRHQTIERFVAAFRDCGFKREAFLPCYGLAESTLFISGGPAGSGPREMWTCGRALERHEIRRVEQPSPDARCLVSSGQIADGTDVLIVDPQTRRICPPDVVGEIWIGAHSVADGYWHKTRDTQSTFHGVLADSSNTGRYLRTGDTGIIDNGELFIIGRIKDVIIVRGRKIYPQDVEVLVEGVLGRTFANYVAAFGVDADEGEGLAVVVEADRRLSRVLRQHCNGSNEIDSESLYHNEVKALIAAIREAISAALDVALHSLYIVKLGAFPRTSSGKVRRNACKAAAVAGVPEVVFEWHLPVDDGRFRLQNA